MSSYFTSLAEMESLTGFHIRQNLITRHLVSDQNLTKIDGKLFLASYPYSFFTSAIYQKTLYQLLCEHTSYPVHKLCSNSTFKVQILKHYSKISNRNRVFLMLPKIARWTELRFCTECFKIQIQEHGFCWILRDWALPLTDCCSRHKVALSYYECLCEEISVHDAISGIFSGYCNKCHFNIWQSSSLKKIRGVKLKQATWVSDFSLLEPLYLSNAAHKRIFEKITNETNVVLNSEHIYLNLITKYYFRNTLTTEKQKIKKGLRRWLKLIYPIPHETLIHILIKMFKEPMEFREFVIESGLEAYIDNYQLSKKRDLIETYDFFEKLGLRTLPPIKNGDCRYLKLIL